MHKLFRCVVFMHVKRDNLDAMTMKYVFLGYLDGVKAYKLWGLENSKCIVNWDVIFRERVMYMAKKQPENVVNETP